MSFSLISHAMVQIRAKVILFCLSSCFGASVHSTRLSLQGPNVSHLSGILPTLPSMSFSEFLYLHSHAMSSLKRKNERAWIKQTVDIDLSSLQRKVIKGRIIISLMQFLIAPTVNSPPWLVLSVRRFGLLCAGFMQYSSIELPHECDQGRFIWLLF